MNTLEKGLVPDIEKTFGSLTYLGMSVELEKKRNTQGNMVGYGRHYRALSSVLDDREIDIICKITAPKSFQFGDELELVNPVLVEKAVSAGGSYRVVDRSLLVDDMVLKR